MYRLSPVLCITGYPSSSKPIIEVRLQSVSEVSTLLLISFTCIYVLSQFEDYCHIFVHTITLGGRLPGCKHVLQGRMGRGGRLREHGRLPGRVRYTQSWWKYAAQSWCSRLGRVTTNMAVQRSTHTHLCNRYAC